MNGEPACCSDYETLLVDYADGELGEADQARVTAHVQSCLRCRDELRQLDSSLASLKRYWEQLPADVVPAAARSDSRPLVSNGGRRTKVRQAAGWVVATAALVLVGLIAFGERPWGRWGNGMRSVKTRELANKGDASVSDSIPTKPRGLDSAGSSDITALVLRESQVARLQATLDILRTQPLLADEVENIQRQLENHSHFASPEFRPPIVPN